MSRGLSIDRDHSSRDVEGVLAQVASILVQLVQAEKDRDEARRALDSMTQERDALRAQINMMQVGRIVPPTRRNE